MKNGSEIAQQRSYDELLALANKCILNGNLDEAEISFANALKKTVLENSSLVLQVVPM